MDFEKPDLGNPASNEARMRRITESRHKNEKISLDQDRAAMDAEGRIEYGEKELEEARLEEEARQRIIEEFPKYKDIEEAFADGLYIIRKLNESHPSGSGFALMGEPRARMVEAAREVGERLVKLTKEDKLNPRLERLGREMLEAVDEDEERFYFGEYTKEDEEGNKDEISLLSRFRYEAGRLNKWLDQEVDKLRGSTA